MRAPTESVPYADPPALTLDEWRKLHGWLKYAAADVTVHGVELGVLRVALDVTLRRAFPVDSDRA